ncbi:MAG: ferredoxin family protein [Candidatus Omnitrophota bacterium]
MGAGKKKIKIDKQRCKGCGLCVNVCPGQVLILSGEVNKKGFRYAVAERPENCTGCGLCYVICPDCGIEIIGE